MARRLPEDDVVLKDYIFYLNGGASLSEIAKNYGVTTSAITMRMTALRRAGVDVPSKKQGKPIDVVGLNKIIEKEYRR